MGVGSTGAFLAFMAARRGASFRSTITIGRQKLFIWEGQRGFLQSLRPRLTEDQITAVLADEYCEKLFRALGAERVDSLDASPYEEATILHNLNLPIRNELILSYSVVADFGCLEHIFNVTQAIKNCTDMIEVNGWYIYVGPCNNWMGHGFYQFSPEFFFNFLSSNGFSEIEVFITLYNDPIFFRVTDPRVFGGRVELVNDETVQICVLAKKVEHIDELVCPIQSDYRASLWKHQSPARTTSSREEHPVDPTLFAAMSELKITGHALTSMTKRLAPQLVNGFENRLLYEFVDPITC